MSDEYKNIKIARINARQAIIGAVIVGLVSIITTLISTGHLFPKKMLGTSGEIIENVPRTDVLDAPHLSFSTKKIDLSLDQCMNNAKDALENSGFSGMESRRYIAWAYNGNTTGLIWCHTDEEIVIYIGAGTDWPSSKKTSDKLRRLFRTSRK